MIRFVFISWCRRIRAFKRRSFAPWTLLGCSLRTNWRWCSERSRFLAHPDYAEGNEQGLTFGKLTFGSPLPLEIVLRDWRADLNNGDGGCVYKRGDCYAIYEKLHASGMITPEHLNTLIM